MRKQWLIVVVTVLSLGTFAGCSQVEDILNKVNQLLDSSADEEITDEANGETEEIEEDVPINTAEREDENAAEEDSDDEVMMNLPFDEQLVAQGYEIKNLPNGFPFEIPYHWILVEDNLGDATAENYAGTFCFDLPFTIEQIASHVDFFDEVNHEHYGEGNETIHTTTFTMDFGYANVTGTMDFYVDPFDNTCMKMNLLFAEDSNFVISDEAMEEEQGRSGANGLKVNEERERSVVKEYDDLLNNLRENNHLASGETLSINDRLQSGELEMIQLAQGYPKIFPYEWFLIEMTEDYEDGSWKGTFCTDAPMAQTVIKHHQLLAEYNADIVDFKTTNDPVASEKSFVAFAFNDEYGTGSWYGRTTLYIGQEGNYNNHQCIDVSMEFSGELLVIAM